MIEHSVQLRVRYAETDQMKFAHHSNYIVWFEYARIELLRKIGLDYAQLEREGFFLPVLEVNARFRYPARFDDLLTITASIEEQPRAKFTIRYQVSNQQEQVICTGFSRHGFMNSANKAIRPPQVFQKQINKYFAREGEKNAG